MRRAGFTVVELMIALAVSGAIFVAGVTAFNSQRANTEFDQSVYDLQSKIQNLASQASTKAIPVQYGCSKGASGYPVLSTAAASTGECTYLGIAIQIVPGSSILYSYPVFGLTSFTSANANPEPALDNTGKYLFVDGYQLQGKLAIASSNAATIVTTPANTNEQDLLTLYANQQDNNTSGNEISATAYQIQFGSTDKRQTGDSSSSFTPDNLRNCIEGATCGTASNPATSLNTTTWKLCVTDGSRNAMLSIRGTATGISTKLNMNACS